MSVDIKKELREMRNLNRRRISNNLTEKYRELFKKLPPMEEEIMIEYYINGKSYKVCGIKLCYCERQIKRIVSKAIEEIYKESR